MIYKWWVFHPLICWRVHMWETKAKWVNLSGLGIAISPKTYQTCWCDISNPARIVVNWWFNVLFWKPPIKNPTRPDGSQCHGRYPLWLLHLHVFPVHFHHGQPLFCSALLLQSPFSQHFPSFSRHFPHGSPQFPCQAMHQQVTWLLLAIEENGALFLGARQWGIVIIGIWRYRYSPYYLWIKI